ncbi:hypothetical protein O988_00216 [Pseudogymnoascus sp. VKM F-3808]|nr:hypothetical protein O988_00216 [Pseudogymnoascus sp. VKM F-3808]
MARTRLLYSPDIKNRESMRGKAIYHRASNFYRRRSQSNQQMSPLYEIQDMTGKGIGVVAQQDIQTGARILCEPPLFTTADLSIISQMELFIANELKGLSKAQQRQFLSLHNNFPGKQAFSGIVRTNALPLGPGSPTGGIFPIISRINHSCRPNTQHTWNSLKKHETIHAIRNIKKGEEITISYNLGGPSKWRRLRMKENFNFDCTCDLCSQPDEVLKVSDDRQVRIQILDDAIGDASRLMTSPGNALSDCRELLSLYEVEAITDARVARVCYDAFQICITHGDEARASSFARMAYETRLYLEGEDSSDTQKMKVFITSPAKHMSFGYSQRWKQSMKKIPKDLSAEEFKLWLWRLAKTADA